MSKPISRMARQGDILIVKVADLPDGLTPVEKDKGRDILAYGEVTGHAHAVANSEVSNLFVDIDSNDVDEMRDRFLSIEKDTEIVHEEHDSIPLGPGVYKVIRQVQYEPEGYKYVAD